MFRQQIQNAIDQGKLKFKTPSKSGKLIKIDQHPFPTNMIEVSKKNALQTKVFTSELAKNKGVVDPKAQIIAEEVKGKGLLEEGESSKASK